MTSRVSITEHGIAGGRTAVVDGQQRAVDLPVPPRQEAIPADFLPPRRQQIDGPAGVQEVQQIRVLTTKIISYKGKKNSTTAARDALRGLNWVDANNVEVNWSENKIIIPCIGGVILGGEVRVLLNQAGFEVQGQSVASRPAPAAQPVQSAVSTTPQPNLVANPNTNSLPDPTTNPLPNPKPAPAPLNRGKNGLPTL